MTDEPSGSPEGAGPTGPTGPTGAAFAALVRAVATDLLDRKDELNRLDAVAGDGDLGLTVSTAARALLELAPTLEDLPEADAIRRCGTEIARRAPSTGGTLIAFAFMAAAKADIPEGASPLARAAAYLDAAATSVAQRGQVEPGDRTMLDALRPAADTFARLAASGGDSMRAAREAAAAADSGARSTSSMTAKVGRAGWLAERAAGHEDAGAFLVALAFSAGATYLGVVDGSLGEGRADYFRWQALFEVLAEPVAAPFVAALVPGLRISDRIRSIAGDFVRSEAVVTTNAAADDVLGRSLALIEAEVDDLEFQRLVELSRLIEVDPSGGAELKSTWSTVLRRWADDPAIEGPEREIVDALRPLLIPEPGVDQFTINPPKWHGNVSFGLERLLFEGLESRLQALSETARRRVIERARDTLRSLGMPEEFSRF